MIPGLTNDQKTKTIRAITAYYLIFATLALTGFAIEAIGTSVFKWESGGVFFGFFVLLGAALGLLASALIMGFCPSIFRKDK